MPNSPLMDLPDTKQQAQSFGPPYMQPPAEQQWASQTQYQTQPQPVSHSYYDASSHDQRPYNQQPYANESQQQPQYPPQGQNPYIQPQLSQQEYPITQQWVPSANQSQPQQGQQEGSGPGKASVLTKTMHSGKQAWDKLWDMGMKLGDPVNRFTNRVGSEAFWPTTMDKESDKAARILKSFCKDGFYADQPSPVPTGGPKGKQKVLVNIPQKVIQNAVGLAIFSTMRTGMWISGAGGSGVLVARLPDGSWSPPSGILVHTLGVGFMVGIDIYDCVVVINSYEALKAFSTFRVTLGTEMSAVAGPVGAGGIVESDIRPNRRSPSRSNTAINRAPIDPISTELQQQAEREKRSRKPVFTYMKSRGLYVGLQVDGTFILERKDENAAFYGQRVGVEQILKGHVQSPPSTRMLTEVLKAAEGKVADQHMMDMAGAQPPPSEYGIEKTREASQEQKVHFAPDAETKKQMADFESLHEHSYTQPQQDGFPEYDPSQFEDVDADAMMAARLQAEEDEHARNVAGDIAPSMPPRPNGKEKNADYIAAPVVGNNDASGSSVMSATATGYPNEKSAAYVAPREARVEEASGSSRARPVSEVLPPYGEAAAASGANGTNGYPADVKGPPAPTYK